jgi:hypothetical protein
MYIGHIQDKNNSKNLLTISDSTNRSCKLCKNKNSYTKHEEKMNKENDSKLNNDNIINNDSLNSKLATVAKYVKTITTDSNINTENIDMSNPSSLYKGANSLEDAMDSMFDSLEKATVEMKLDIMEPNDESYYISGEC